MLAGYPSVENKAFATTLFPAHAHLSTYLWERSGGWQTGGKVATIPAPLSDDSATLGRLLQLAHVVLMIGDEALARLARIKGAEPGRAPTILGQLESVLMTDSVHHDIGCVTA